MAEPIRVVITGAAGQIGYSLVYMIASGSVFGDDQVHEREQVTRNSRFGSISYHVTATHSASPGYCTSTWGSQWASHGAGRLRF
jgi:hypothetical protein